MATVANITVTKAGLREGLPKTSQCDHNSFLISQMPRGVPVATVAIGNATNAGLLAARILAASDDTLHRKMLEYQVCGSSKLSYGMGFYCGAVRTLDVSLLL